MLTLLTQSISNTSFGIFFPKFNGTIYEILAAPISTFEVVLAFVGAGATKTLTYGNYYQFPGGTAPTLSTVTAAIDRLDYIVHTAVLTQAVLTKAYTTGT